ncbi:probable peroxiredoxin prdx-3 isoform X8 [Ixodes scapularis]|uniref:probable peroxiredoxin prdx-3 isoform X8 n=1 Tax=Ixodes scapularis TaxID=6945 RepID=UPI001AD6A1BA|nr:probable peroxiredoxin prdx-3 isoform X8 [Ixodes scapularis]XP_040359229.1 probable peroxiredoxin prdx-3 isoform X8 [Ixodes scapularis]
MEEPVTALVPLHSNQDADGAAEARRGKRKGGETSAASSIKWYKQKFRESWLLDDRFKNWLVSVPDDPYRAKCKLCNADLRAGKSELEKHAKTKHHRDTVKAVEDVKALLGFANQAEAQVLPDMVVELPSADQVHEDELSRPLPCTTLPTVPSQRRSPPVAVMPSPVPSRSPQVQSYAPDFRGIAVVDNQIREIQLSDYHGKFLLLFFYPQDFTLACPSELVEYSERAADFRSINAEIVAVSTDSYSTHLAWTNTPRKLGGLGKVNVPLLSDFTKKISKDYHVLLEEGGIALRASFLIDPRGMIRQSTINDVNLYRSVDETLRLLKALQYIEKHGTAISSSWEPEPSSGRTSERLASRTRVEK